MASWWRWIIQKTGDKVEILTAKRGGPSLDWLNPNLGLVKTQRARSKIRQWFKRQAREKNMGQGKAMLEKELRRLGLMDTNLDRLAREFELRGVESCTNQSAPEIYPSPGLSNI